MSDDRLRRLERDALADPNDPAKALAFVQELARTKTGAPRAPDWPAILAEIPLERRDEIRGTLETHYLDLLTTDHPIVLDGEVLRFKADPLARWLADHTNLNELWSAAIVERGTWSWTTMRRFYREMHYSLCGFGEVFTRDKRGIFAPRRHA